MSEPQPIPLHELPDRMRALAIEMKTVGDAIAYFGGFGPFGEYGALLTEQSAPVLASLADAMERMHVGGGHA